MLIGRFVYVQDILCLFGSASGVFAEPFIRMVGAHRQLAEIGSLFEALQVSDLDLVPHVAYFGF